MNTDSYLTITVHFLNQTKLKTFVLCTKKLESSHTGMYLCEKISEELNNWNIYEKVIAIITDGGANIKSAVRIMNLPHLPCIAHKLNLIVQQSLQLTEIINENVATLEHEDDDDDSLKKILKTCRNIVGFFKRNEVGNRLLAEKQKQLGSKTILKLKQDVHTRWNSTYFMLERLIIL